MGRWIRGQIDAFLALLDRSMTMEEVDYITEMVRRITAITLLQPALDTNYEAVKTDSYNWPV